MLGARTVEQRVFADDFPEGRASSCAKGREDSPTHGEGVKGVNGVGGGREGMERAGLGATRRSMIA